MNTELGGRHMKNLGPRRDETTSFKAFRLDYSFLHLQDQRGLALLIVIAAALAAMFLGISLTSTAASKYLAPRPQLSQEQAFQIADRGFAMAQKALLGQELSALMTKTTRVEHYLPYAVPTNKTEHRFFSRNPLALEEARQLDFLASPPTARGSSALVHGLLAPPAGVPLRKFGAWSLGVLDSGLYLAKIADNDDEVPPRPNDPLVDRDGRFFLRVMGIQPRDWPETQHYGTVPQNSVSVIEAAIRRDATFDFCSPLTLYGPDIKLALDSDSIRIDGNPHDLRGNPTADPPVSALTLVNNDPVNGDAEIVLHSVTTLLRGRQLKSLFPADSSPVRDYTDDLRSGANRDAETVFDPGRVVALARQLKIIADNRLPANSVVETVSWGTASTPQITYVDGDLKIRGPGSGAGILVVNGALEAEGPFGFQGLVLVLGGQIRFHGAPKSVSGGVFAARVVADGNGSYRYGVPDVELSGSIDLRYSPAAIYLASNLIPPRILSWRQVTRELEPY